MAGRAEIEGVRRKVRVPLLTQPVRLERTLSGYRIVAAGDAELTPLLEDRGLAAEMEAAPGLATPGWLEAIGTKSWLWSAAEATGLPIDAVTTATSRLPGDRLVVVAAAALFVGRDVFGGGLVDSLRSWAGRELHATALAAVYDPPGEPEPDSTPILSPLPLTQAQEKVVARARTAPVTVVSGPPGSGKSHTVIAAALEVVHRGGSVLVATQSPHAADVLAALLTRYPSPSPVLFGNAERRAALAAELAGGAADGPSERELRADQQTVTENHDLVRGAAARLQAALAEHEAAAGLPAWQPLLPGLAADVPGAFDDAVDLDRAVRLLDRAGSSWWARWRVRRMLHAAGGVPEEKMREAIRAATAQRAAARLAAAGGTDLAPQWEGLQAAEETLAQAVGAAMHRAARSRKRWDAEARRGAAALAAALRAGRNRRRELLSRLDAASLVRALPLWIGTVADVEDLLPATPGMFDLVVLDEASHVDQIRAAPVLARARRALVVGDPRQLRFVSFVSDVDVAEVLSRYHADDRLDVRRVSTYDLAAGAAPAIWLDEHHRSTPHLIGFSAHRFYDDRVTVATRHPRTEAVDAISLVRVGTAAAEVDAVVGVVRSLAESGRTGIGVVSPFRPQAEALEKALLAAFPTDEIERLGLRVGTVHAFQGSEAGTVVASLGLDPGAPAGRRRFATDPHLFNVMITRARHRLIVVTAQQNPDGLLGDFFTWADKPPPIDLAPDPDGWPGVLTAELRRQQVTVRPAYKVGTWTVDLCVGPPDSAIGVFCAVHEQGPQAHIDRRRALRRAGWQLLDIFGTDGSSDPRRAALEIATVVQGARDHPGIGSVPALDSMSAPGSPPPSRASPPTT
ncbi:AAA domain-containing protein [Actinoplanes sp. TFC3]|uniref:AAA domain-containing protein n=1 Tax=Actinoplanes sp. TFC3 TaxID=1710355 RepID=UPI000832A698|nr:AAA domain-containing protein [Actinoplanes sp. TFC3]